jgi:hypothetical protein
LYATGRGINDPAQKKALLLHFAGKMVQDIYFTFDEPAPREDQTVYDVSVGLLNDYFRPQTNTAFERSGFRAMSQTETKTVANFITRLRQKAVYCNFADTNVVVGFFFNMIRAHD